MVEFVYFARVDALNAGKRGIKEVTARNLLESKIGPHFQQDHPDPRPPFLDHVSHQPEGDHQRLARYNGPEATTNRRQEDTSFV